mgnify:CR=1 FL=1
MIFLTTLDTMSLEAEPPSSVPDSNSSITAEERDITSRETEITHSPRTWDRAELHVTLQHRRRRKKKKKPKAKIEWQRSRSKQTKILSDYIQKFMNLDATTRHSYGHFSFSKITTSHHISHHTCRKLPTFDRLFGLAMAS